jgi:predicted O-methyltransferase YrrM
VPDRAGTASGQMKDNKSSLPSLLWCLAQNGGRKISAHRLFELGRDLTTAVKNLGGLPAMWLDDIPGIENAVVSSHLQNTAIIAIVAKLIKAKNVFEFGTYDGRTAAIVARENPDCHVVTLDLPVADYKSAVALSAIEVSDEYLFQGVVRGEVIPAEAKVTQIRIDSAKFDPEPYAGQMDLIYVDASHSYSGVRNDTEKALHMLSPHGVIIWDDYYYPGVWRYLNELDRERPDLKMRRIRRWTKAMTTEGLM